MHPVQGNDHPNEYTVAKCPSCHSMRIHKRKGFHLINKWRCDKCHEMFFNPEWKRVVYWNSTPPNYAIVLK